MSYRLFRSVFLITIRGDSLLTPLIRILRRSQLRGIEVFLGLRRISAPSMILRILTKASSSAAIYWARDRTFIAK